MENLVSMLPNESNNNESDDKYIFNELVSLSNLTMLEVSQCMSLKYICTTSTVKCLEQLRDLKIRECKSMEEIILSEEIEENTGRIVIPVLVKLRLENLQNLKRFSVGHSIDFPLLAVLEILRCSKIKNLVSKLPNKSNNNDSDDEYSSLFDELVIFSKLEKLHVEGINKLRHIWSEDINILNMQIIKVSNCLDRKYVFPALVACGLPQLRELRIKKCGIEVIILKAKDKTVQMEWPKLSYLKVRDCNKLLKCGYNYVKLFPNMKHFNIDFHCAKAMERDGTQVFCTSGKRILRS